MVWMIFVSVAPTETTRASSSSSQLSRHSSSSTCAFWPLVTFFSGFMCARSDLSTALPVGAGMPSALPSAA